MRPTRTPMPRRSPRDRNRGSHVVTAVLSMGVILGAAALAIDVPFLRGAAIEAQYAADAGAHAALVELKRGARPRDAEATGKALAMSLRVGAGQVSADDVEIDLGAWDYEDQAFSEGGDFINAARVRVQVTRTLLLAPIFGSAFTVGAPRGESVAAFRNREIIVVQDVTGSFKEEIDLAREADLTLLDALDDYGLPADRVAMITFTGDAQLYTPLQNVDTHHGEIRAAWSLLDWCQKTPAEAGAGYDPSREHMMPCAAGGDGTNQGAGIDLALQTFLDEGDRDALWVILLLSDGKAQCIPSKPFCDAGRFALGRASVARAAEHSVHIYTVSYNERYDPVQTGYLEDLTAGMGRFYETPDAAELPAILDRIARNIPIAVVQ